MKFGREVVVVHFGSGLTFGFRIPMNSIDSSIQSRVYDVFYTSIHSSLDGIFRLLHLTVFGRFCILSIRLVYRPD